MRLRALPRERRGPSNVIRCAIDLAESKRSLEIPAARGIPPPPPPSPHRIGAKFFSKSASGRADFGSSRLIVGERLQS